MLNVLSLSVFRGKVNVSYEKICFNYHFNLNTIYVFITYVIIVSFGTNFEA